MGEGFDPVPSSDIEDLTRAVLAAASARQMTLATAEDCTGGSLAALLTDMPGWSDAFERGFVAYTDAAKTEMLGVPSALLVQGSAVSQQTVIAMAEGAIQRSDADVSVAITGWTEDGSDTERPLSLVHFACARREGYTHHRQVRFGDVGRQALRVECLRMALKMFEQALKL